MTTQVKSGRPAAHPFVSGPRETPPDARATRHAAPSANTSGHLTTIPLFSLGAPPSCCCRRKSTVFTCSSPLHSSTCVSSSRPTIKNIFFLNDQIASRWSHRHAHLSVKNGKKGRKLGRKETFVAFHKILQQVGCWWQLFPFFIHSDASTTSPFNFHPPPPPPPPTHSFVQFSQEEHNKWLHTLTFPTQNLSTKFIFFFNFQSQRGVK